nr:MAG TPA: hypothetical protein [Caudoviricetes sp.]
MSCSFPPVFVFPVLDDSIILYLRKYINRQNAHICVNIFVQYVYLHKYIIVILCI